MKMLRNKRVIWAIAGILVVLITYYVYTQVGEKEASYKVPVLNQEYINEGHGFSLTMPEGFTARESSSEGVDTIVFEDDRANGIQIVISPFEDVKVLTREMIEADIPDMKVLNPESVEIGDDYQGLAFRSDNDAFDGKSREVWFVFRGELYQISTYERFDPLLKAMFSTWQFGVK